MDREQIEHGVEFCRCIVEEEIEHLRCDQALDNIIQAFDEFQRKVNKRLDDILKEYIDAENAYLRKREWRRLCRIDIN
jgi:uncharacterized iron-regulated protein